MGGPVVDQVWGGRGGVKGSGSSNGVGWKGGEGCGPKGDPNPEEMEVGPKNGWGPNQNFTLSFSLSHTHFRSFCLSLGVSSLNFGV